MENMEWAKSEKKGSYSSFFSELDHPIETKEFFQVAQWCKGEANLFIGSLDSTSFAAFLRSRCSAAREKNSALFFTEILLI